MASCCGRISHLTSALGPAGMQALPFHRVSLQSLLASQPGGKGGCRPSQRHGKAKRTKQSIFETDNKVFFLAFIALLCFALLWSMASRPCSSLPCSVIASSLTRLSCLVVVDPHCVCVAVRVSLCLCLLCAAFLHPTHAPPLSIHSARLAPFQGPRSWS